jgi:hypothetical protein
MTAPDNTKRQIIQAKYIIRQQMARIAELEALVENLRSAAGAHDVLRSIYSDANQPTGHRLKAAGLALGHESPPLKPVEPALELAAEPVIPLADLVAQRRARQERMEVEMAAAIEQDLKAAEAQSRERSRHNGNGLIENKRT